MLIDPLNGASNLYNQTQRISGPETGPFIPTDQTIFRMKPGGITCYMWAAMRELSSTDPEKLAEMRRDALARAVNEGIVSSETANKLQER